ncbi:MAG: hypothetical protein L0331_06000, partial [Chloroflexi bacterium]|nr:hypothetical protein [Chloroflexota bacterium]
MFRTRFLIPLLFAVSILVLVACQAGAVEVTRVVENTVVETRVVEVEGEEVIVEVTRVVTEEVVVEPTAAPIPQGGDVVESSFADGSTLNPVVISDQASNDIANKLFLSLVTLEAFTGNVIGQIA